MKEMIEILADWTPPYGGVIRRLTIDRSEGRYVIRLIVEFPDKGSADTGDMVFTEKFIAEAAVPMKRFIHDQLTRGYTALLGGLLSRDLGPRPTITAMPPTGHSVALLGPGPKTDHHRDAAYGTFKH
jgi:hypothetical protein